MLDYLSFSDHASTSKYGYRTLRFRGLTFLHLTSSHSIQQYHEFVEARQFCSLLFFQMICSTGKLKSVFAKRLLSTMH